MNWKPIDTAPKDGTQILVPVGHGLYNVVSYYDGGWREGTNGLRLRNEPTIYCEIEPPNP